MNVNELCKRLDNAGLSFEVVESFEGCRIIRFLVNEDENEDESETVTIKTDMLTGAALDWVVAQCEDLRGGVDNLAATWGRKGWANRWEMAGPIIQRENINVFMENEKWQAYASHSLPRNFSGDDGDDEGNPLLAAMRCYAASVFGENVDVPSNLI